MSQRKEDSARDSIGRSHRRGPSYFACYLVRRFAPMHQILVSKFGTATRFGTAVKFDGFGNLAKALTFSSQRAACVAKCHVSEHFVIHAFDAGQDLGAQQQSTLFDQLGHFREAQLGILKDLRGAVLGGLGHRRILRVHLLHGLSQGCHVIEHRNTSPAILASKLLPPGRQLLWAQ
jgi:hypothetical protein